MKSILLIHFLFITFCFGQTIPDSELYLSQTPPAYSPKVFQLQVSDGMFTAERITISKDGKEIYYNELNAYPITNSRIKYYKYFNNKWNGPFTLFEDFTSPALAKNDSILFYQKSSTESWYSVRNDTGWSIPHKTLSIKKQQHYLQVTNQGNYYFTSDPVYGKIGDISKLVINNKDTSIQNLGMSINTLNNGMDFFIARDESYIIHVIRNNGIGDLYISYHKPDGSWTNPTNLGPQVNSQSAWEYGPFVTFDNKYLFYTRIDNSNKCNIYWVRIDNLIDSLKHISLTPYLKSPLPGQTDPGPAKYFGQTPPGDSAVIFAPGLVSLSDRFENAITFSPDGKECCFSTYDGINWTWGTILYSRFENNKWSEFKPAPFIDSTKYFDILPIFSPDGNKFLFSSARPYKEYNYVDLWMCKRSEKGWNKPVNLGASINEPKIDESFSSIANNGDIYFNKDITGSIWFSKLMNGKYSKAVKVDKPINSGYGDGSAFIAPDQSYIIFSSKRPGGYGEPDLYISFMNIDGTWTEPKNLGPKINSPYKEEAPRISPDGKYLFFSRSIVNKFSDIYWVKTDIIDSQKSSIIKTGVK